MVRWKDITIVHDESEQLIFKLQTIRKWTSFNQLYEAFRNPDTGNYEPKTWAQLIVKIPKATLSRLLTELINGEFIEVFIEIDKKSGKRPTYYRILKEWQPEAFLPAVNAWLKMPDEKKEYLGIFHGTGRRRYVWNENKTRQEQKIFFQLPPNEMVRLRQKIVSIEEKLTSNK